MTVREAKEILRKRYSRRGHVVTRISHTSTGFRVSFGVDENGKGKGPMGLQTIKANWPTEADLPQLELALANKRRRRKS